MYMYDNGVKQTITFKAIKIQKQNFCFTKAHTHTKAEKHHSNKTRRLLSDIRWEDV